MPKEIPAIRILPMSDKIEGFRDRSIEDVQQKVFLRELPKMNGRFRYRATGLNAPAGTIVLFQFQARIIASAVFLRDEKFKRPVRGHTGELHLDPESFQTFEPLDVEAMRKIWPWFKSFGHAKQSLNPTRYAAFRKKLKMVEAPVTGRSPKTKRQALSS